MHKQPKGPPQKSVYTPAAPSPDAIKQKQKAEELEVSGLHKNQGPKDHKGVR